MNIFLVGGAVRDQLLGLEVKDKDWVVVGADMQTLIHQGYHQIGSDFPVFLHPKTHEEYALARTERKSGQGYTGFICDFSPEVTLEEDLKRRDLTINAIAQTEDGRLIDPYHGQADLQQRILRHVSQAFTEDPLRVLRVARFAARFHHLGFKIADETQDLMKNMVKQGELNALTPERVWLEWEKSLHDNRPDIFLSTLRDCGALQIILPEIDALFGVPQPVQWHPEIDTGVHTLMVAHQAALLTKDPVIRFAAQLHDLGKACTPKAEWPRHKHHEQTGITPIKALCTRLNLPSIYRDAACMICAEHTHIHQISQLDAKTFIQIFDRNDCWRKPERIMQLALACRADHQGRTGYAKQAYPQAEILIQTFDIAQKVDVKAIVAQGFQGEKIRAELSRQRIEAVKNYLQQIRTTKN